LPSSKIQAVCCNSGNANACTGIRGKKDVEATAAHVGKQLGVPAKSVLVASTGVIGKFLPMDAIKKGSAECIGELDTDGGNRFAQAIMTTDLVSKEYAITVKLKNGEFRIGGCCKGSGMIHPKMATMLAFITTDAAISSKNLQDIVKQVVNWTFNNLTVDGDTSTNDMVLTLANGASGTAVTSKTDLDIFRDAFFDVCNNLCAAIAADGEGATKRIEINVTGGKTYEDCKLAAKSIANSNLVKTALFGNDPNWGRILCAIGYSGAEFSDKKMVVSLCGMPVCKEVRPVSFPMTKMRTLLKKKIVIIDVELGMGGKTCAVAHTCDLTYDYIKINAEYHT
jgi:glutamate N-acetyltransferase/amino-acid N-acetyltransferase